MAWPAGGLSLRTILDRSSKSFQRDLRPVFECNSLRLMAAMARRGKCIAFQTRVGIEQELAAGTLKFVLLAERRLPIDRLMIVRRPGDSGKRAADVFLELAQRLIPDPKPVRSLYTDSDLDGAF